MKLSRDQRILLNHRRHLIREHHDPRTLKFHTRRSPSPFEELRDRETHRLSIVDRRPPCRGSLGSSPWALVRKPSYTSGHAKVDRLAWTAREHPRDDVDENLPVLRRAVRRSRETRGHWLRENLPPPPAECADRRLRGSGWPSRVARKGWLLERRRERREEEKRRRCTCDRMKKRREESESRNQREREERRVKNERGKGMQRASKRRTRRVHNTGNSRSTFYTVPKTTPTKERACICVSGLADSCDPDQSLVSLPDAEAPSQSRLDGEWRDESVRISASRNVENFSANWFYEISKSSRSVRTKRSHSNSQHSVTAASTGKLYFSLFIYARSRSLKWKLLAPDDNFSLAEKDFIPIPRLHVSFVSRTDPKARNWRGEWYRTERRSKASPSRLTGRNRVASYPGLPGFLADRTWGLKRGFAGQSQPLFADTISRYFDM